MLNQVKTFLAIIGFATYTFGKIKGWINIPAEIETELNTLFWLNILFWLKVGFNRSENQTKTGLKFSRLR